MFYIEPTIDNGSTRSLARVLLSYLSRLTVNIAHACFHCRGFPIVPIATVLTSPRDIQWPMNESPAVCRLSLASHKKAIRSSADGLASIDHIPQRSYSPSIWHIWRYPSIILKRQKPGCPLYCSRDKWKSKSVDLSDSWIACHWPQQKYHWSRFNVPLHLHRTRTWSR